MPKQNNTLLSLLSGGKYQHTGVGKYKNTPGGYPTVPETAHSFIDNLISQESKVLFPSGKNIFGGKTEPFTKGDLIDLTSSYGKILWRGVNPWVRGMVKDGKFIGGGINTKWQPTKSKYPLFTSTHKGVAELYAKKSWEVIAEKARLLKKSTGNKGKLLKFDVPDDYIDKHGIGIGYGSGEIRFDSGLPKQFLKKVYNILDREPIVYENKIYKRLKPK